MVFTFEEVAERSKEVVDLVENVVPKTIKVTIGGVPLMEQNFYWSLTSGVMPHIWKFTIEKSRSPLIDAIQSPTTIEVSAQGTDGEGEPKEFNIEFKNIFILQRKGIDEFIDMWEIADIRWPLFQGKTTYFAYNITRRQNLLGLGITDVPRTDPAILREPFDVFKTGRYLPNSVKPDGTPFTVLEILEIEIKNLLFQTQVLQDNFDLENIIIRPLDDKSYIKENIRSDGVSAYNSIGELLLNSRLKMGVTPDGKITIDSFDFFDERSTAQIVELQKKKKVAPGTIYLQDLKRVRPKTITVKFERRIETLIKAIPEEQEVNLPRGEDRPVNPIKLDVDGKIITERMDTFSQAIACVNVIQVPFVPDFDGEVPDFKFGEYIPFQQYLQAIKLDKDSLGKLWWDNSLEVRITRVLQEGVKQAKIEPLAFKIASALRSSYRQVYMIDPFYTDRMDDWEFSRVSIIDTYSRFSPRSPLWSDYAMVPRVRPVDIAKNRAIDTNYIKNWRVNDEDPNRAIPTTAGTISPIDPELGVFRVDFPRDVDAVVGQIIPSAIDNPPLAQTGGQVGLQRFMLANSNARISKDFTLETIASIKWMFDPTLGGGVTGGFNSDLRYHNVTFEYDGEGPPVTYLSYREPARMDLDFTLVNEDIINAIAESEAARIFNQYRDRFVGTVQVPGLLKLEDEITLRGNITNVSYSIAPGQPGVSGGVETHVYMRQIPMAPRIEQTMPDKAVQYVFRQLNRDNKS